MNRLLAFGCSHTVGAELTAPGVGYNEKNNELCYGGLVASKLGREFYNAGRSGNSNNGIALDVIELAQPGDIVLVGWTYTGRDEYINNNEQNMQGDLISIGLLDFMTTQIESSPLRKFENWILSTRQRGQMAHNHFGLTASNELKKALIDYHNEITSYSFNRLHNFLRDYMLVDGYCKSNDIVCYQFIFDIESEILELLNNADALKFKPYPLIKYSHNIEEQKLLARNTTFATSRIYTHIHENPYFFKLGDNDIFKSAARLVKNKQGQNYQNKNYGHADANGHVIICEYLHTEIQKLS